MTYEETKPLTRRDDGLTFESDGIHDGWLRCSRCFDLIPAGGAAIRRHQCRYSFGPVPAGAPETSRGQRAAYD